MPKKKGERMKSSVKGHKQESKFEVKDVEKLGPEQIAFNVQVILFVRH